MSYRQLTPEQRYRIYACVKADWTQLAIAAEVGVHPATISRELKRNRGGRAATGPGRRRRRPRRGRDGFLEEAG
jgi:transposase, IS30 family